MQKVLSIFTFLIIAILLSSCQKTEEIIYDVDVIFIDNDDGTIIDIQKVTPGESAIEPSTPIKPDYKFIGWDRDFSHITDNTTVRALFEKQSFRVEFLDYDETVLKRLSVGNWRAVVAPESPTRENYIFTGWDPEPTSVITEDVTFVAQYEFAIEYVVVNDEVHIDKIKAGHMKTINIPETIEGKPVTKIKRNTFTKAIYLEEIILPQSIITIEEGALRGLMRLKKITLPFIGKNSNEEERNSQFGIIFGDTFYSASYSSGGYYIPESLETVIITNSNALYSQAFIDAKKIKQIVIQSPLQVFQSDVFLNIDNIDLFFDLLEPKDSWDNEWQGNNLNVYYQGDWEYNADGNPIIIKKGD